VIRNIVPAKDPKLRKVSKSIKKIDKKMLSLAKDLKDTLRAQKDPEGVGLAAPQIGVFVRMFAMDNEGEILIVINPKIVSISKSVTINKKGEDDDILEGCLSIPNFYGPIKRSNKITIKYKDIKGDTITRAFKGFPAQIVQHEIDHLEGVLFVDKLLEQKKSLYKIVDNEWEKVDLVF
jgi:peptide deformylase